MNGLFDYQCVVHESGYEITTVAEIVESTPDGDVVVYYIRPIDPKSTKRIYNIMEHTGAYYEFAHPFIDLFIYKKGQLTLHGKYSDLDDCMIKFANKYGLLTISTYQESTTMWLDNIINMLTAVASLEWIKEGNLEGLKNFFIKEDNKFKIRGNAEVAPYIHRDIPTNGQTPPRNYSEAAYHFISHVVNYNIKDSLVTEIFVNPTNTSTDMVVRPKDLLSALWLQLAHAVSRNLEFKQCSDCSTFFEVKSKKRRFEKIYCSDKCRKRVSARKRRAEEKAK